MHFIKPAITETTTKLGTEYTNDIINLDNVISIYTKSHTVDPPDYFLIEFECVGGSTKRWYYNSMKEMFKVHSKIEDYIKLNQNSI